MARRRSIIPGVSSEEEEELIFEKKVEVDSEGSGREIAARARVLTSRGREFQLKEGPRPGGWRTGGERSRRRISLLIWEGVFQKTSMLLKRGGKASEEG